MIRLLHAVIYDLDVGFAPMLLMMPYSFLLISMSLRFDKKVDPEIKEFTIIDTFN